MKEIIMLSKVSKDAKEKIFDLVYNQKDKNFHYLALDRQLTGFSSLGTYVLKLDDLRENEGKIISSIIEKQEVCTFYPKYNLSLYPFTPCEDGNYYNIDLVNIKKHFADVLEINDNLMKTKHLYVCIGHRANNYSYEIIHPYLEWLLKKSKVLKTIYVEDY